MTVDNTADQRDPQDTDLPDGLSNPARRALANAGVLRLEQLTSLTEGEVRKLHGVGPKAIDQLSRALSARGLSFAAGPASKDNGTHR